MGQRQSNATPGCNKKKVIGHILFLHFEESLASSNLNSKLLRFHCAHPNQGKKPQCNVCMVTKLFIPAVYVDNTEQVGKLEN